MKLQLTAIAAAVALTVSFSASAASNPVTETTNLNDVQWGVDNRSNGNTYTQDNTAWTTNDLLTDNDFPTARFSFTPGNLPDSNASGQNIEATTQTGTGNSASTVQTNTDNESSIDQNGNLHFADTDQQGEGSYSRVNQHLGEGGVVNTLQTGNDHRSAVDQLGNSFNGADIYQEGSNNASYVLQGTQPGGADHNSAYVTQAGGGNKSYIGQTHGDHNIASATQNGTDGTSYIIQMGGSNEATLIQNMNADQNESYILQDNQGFLAVGGHYAKVTQGGGSSNIATVTQLGQASANAHSTVNQSGGSNQASVLQY